MCDAIDKHEAAEYFQRLLMEYYEWLVNLQTAGGSAAVLEGILYVGELWYIQALL